MFIIHNFAVFEGGDGSGTSTQLGLLRRRFDAQNTSGLPSLPPLHTTFEPSDGPIGALIRSALKGEFSLKGETIARLFAADRNEHLYARGGVLERSEQGELVVSDRYTLSSLVYQGIDCGEELPRSLNEAFPGPELLIFFDLDPETAQKRLEGRPGRDIYEYLEFQVKVRERYKALLPEYEKAGVRVELVDASQKPEEVEQEVWRALQKMPILGT